MDLNYRLVQCSKRVKLSVNQRASELQTKNQIHSQMVHQVAPDHFIYKKKVCSYIKQSRLFDLSNNRLIVHHFNPHCVDEYITVGFQIPTIHFPNPLKYRNVLKVGFGIIFSKWHPKLFKIITNTFGFQAIIHNPI